jgi:hypothetical protein
MPENTSSLRRQLMDRIETKTRRLSDALSWLQMTDCSLDLDDRGLAIANAQILLAEEFEESGEEMTEGEWEEYLRDLDPPGEPDEPWTEEDERAYQQTIADDTRYFRRER